MSRTELLSRDVPAALMPRRIPPVRVWAVLGVAFLVFDVYVFGSWILLGEAYPTPVGPTPVPTYMQAAAWAVHILGFIALAVFVFFFGIRPAVRARRITLDGYSSSRS